MSNTPNCCMNSCKNEPKKSIITRSNVLVAICVALMLWAGSTVALGGCTAASLQTWTQYYAK